MLNRLMIRKNKRTNVVKLASSEFRQSILADMDSNLKKIINIIGKSNETCENKEQLANMLMFMLNIVDIEHEKINYEKIKSNGQSEN